MNEGDLFDNLTDAGEEKTPVLPERHPVEPAAEDAPLFDTAAGSEPPAERSEEAAFEPEPPAESAPPEPEPEPEPEVPHSVRMPRAGTLGQTMAALRRDRGMDLADVANETMIKPSYLEALENDSFSELPHIVYVMAYVKKLCGLYGVSAADAEELVAGLRQQLAYEIPEDIDKSVICREQDEETRRKLQQITAALIAGAVLIVLVLVIGVTTLILRAQRGKSDPATIESTLTEDWLARQRKPPVLKTTRSNEKPPRR